MIDRYFTAGLAIALALGLPDAAAARPSRPAAAQAESKRAAALPAGALPVAKTAAGSYVIGDPKAPNLLVEYMSYTCPHCSHFAAEADAAIKPYVQSGKLRVEIRTLLRDPVDMAAATLARCGAPARFPGNHLRLMASQTRWIERAQRTPEDRQQQWFVGDYGARIDKIASDIGLYDELAGNGYNRAQLRTCANDVGVQDALIAQTRKAVEAEGVEGTPSFFLNGKRLEASYNWATLKPALDAL